uniref:26S proteasome non-ATPase regulatory subunit 4 homolog n=1 Tax=Erigeron canadensis TaxID=72917 RepID=UPI001CB8E85C|nr:26S proteasome non-ATPase regulatory subunit 4 homolog [Erigeron canadensis]
MGTPEATMICLDDSACLRGHRWSKAQFVAVKVYCELKFKCNPENRVGLLGMGSFKFGPTLSPTNDMNSIILYLEDMYLYNYGERADFYDAMGAAASKLWDFARIKRRILAFVGSPINMHWSYTKPLGEQFKDCGVALDVVNFFIMKKISHRVEYGTGAHELLYGTYHYGREQLGELVELINTDGNCHIVDMEDVNETSIGRKLQRSRILRKSVRYLVKRKAKKNGDGIGAGENEKLKLEAV